MSIQRSFEMSGAWLFKHRSVLPLLLVPVVLCEFASYRYLNASHFTTECWAVFCLGISLLGEGLRIFTVGFLPKRTSGRNTRCQVAASLNTTGVYSTVRHPLYLGNFLGLIGFIMFFRSPWLVAVTVCLFFLYYERIAFTEEAYLREKFGQDFEQWAALTPAFVPQISKWRAPAARYCWRTALRREYTGLYLVIGGFALLDIITDLRAEAGSRIDTHWAAVFLAATLAYLFLRALKKHTSLLSVEGR